MTRITIFLLLGWLMSIGCKKDTTATTTPINCSGLITDTLNTGDTARIYYPNAFSPNNDGLNDINRLIFKGISAISFTIYDVNNAVVFSTSQQGITDPHGWTTTPAWTPTTNATTFETYYYKIQATTKSNNHIGMCGELYKLACFPATIPRANMRFEDQLTQDGSFSSPTIETLPSCP